MCSEADIDCEVGRQMGCGSFCCHLLVRVEPDEDVPGTGAATGLLEKDADGACIHLDKENRLCRIWERRPRVCRGYHCNGDLFLQIVLRDGFTNLTNLVKAAREAYIPIETFKRIPFRK